MEINEILIILCNILLVIDNAAVLEIEDAVTEVTHAGAAHFQDLAPGMIQTFYFSRTFFYLVIHL